MTKAEAIKCNVCSDILYKRVDRETRYCSCGNILWLEGFAMFTDEEKMERISVDIPHTKDELFLDWNLKLDKLGIIYGSEIDCGDQESKPARRGVSGTP